MGKEVISAESRSPRDGRRGQWISFRRIPKRKRASCVALAVASLVGALAAALPADAAQSVARPAALATSVAPRLPATAARVGAVPPAKRIHLNVVLKVRDQAALSAMVAGLTNRKSPFYHHFLHKGQFGAMFGPTLAQVASVDAALKAAGLAPGRVSADRLSIPVTATAAQVEHAFGTSLVNYRMPGGRVAFANATAPKLDASVAPLVSGISGLNNLYQPQPVSLHHGSSTAGSAPRIIRPRSVSGPQPCQAASAAGPLTADFWAFHYGLTPLYGLGDLGAGQRVAMLEMEPNLPSDISAYEACYGISTHVNYIPVDGGLPSGAGTFGEAAMDIEIVAGLAPKATIDVYQAPQSQNNLDDILRKFVADDVDQTMSVSWGDCELVVSAVNLSDEANLAAEAVAQGQTILAASGDTGAAAEDCLSAHTSGNTESVLSPAAAPNVVSVGGTALVSGSLHDEVVWNDIHGASGGGTASRTCMPAYQDQPAIPGMLDGVTGRTTGLCAGVTPQGYLREVPDVSAAADPTFSGHTIFWGGKWLGGNGGTSASTPLWAAVAALTNASPYCTAYGSGSPGVRPAALYDMVTRNLSAIYGGASPQILRDVTSGNNNWALARVNSGGQTARTGYDLASGLGVPMVTGIGSDGNFDPFIPGYAAAMCRETATRNHAQVHVTKVSPSSGPAGHPARVTITGTNFLPVDGADEVRLTTGTAGGTRTLATFPVNCSSSTTCTTTLPAEPPGTVIDVRVGVLNGGFSVGAPVDNDRFTYSAAPMITRLAPASGPAAGGNSTLLIGVNFTGATQVAFGGKPGTGLRVVSDTGILVNVPPGTAGTTVPVTVTGPGGVGGGASYQYVPAPAVAALSPTHGPTAGGTTITITGSHLAGASSVTFGGKSGTGLKVSGDSSLTVNTPSGGTEGKTVPVVVTTAGGNSNAASYLWADTPHIASISPAKGTHKGGTKVTIKGANFAGVKSVTFGGKAGTHLTVSGTGTLTVTAPKGTRGSKVKVVIRAVGGTSNSIVYRYI
jgi:hypothetical protein